MMDSKTVFDDIYTLDFGLGSWFTCKGHVPKGTVRCVRGKLFQATYHHHDHRCLILGTRGKYTTWTPTDDSENTIENLRAFRAKVIGA